MRILVVDDDRTILMIVAYLLEKYEHEPVLARNGTEAFDLLQREPISFVISDWCMPGMTGLELCRRVRAARFERPVYFILLTGHYDKAAFTEGMDAGADDFLVKPIDKAALRACLRAGEQALALQSASLPSLG